MKKNMEEIDTDIRKKRINKHWDRMQKSIVKQESCFIKNFHIKKVYWKRFEKTKYIYIYIYLLWLEMINCWKNTKKYGVKSALVLKKNSLVNQCIIKNIQKVNKKLW